MREIKFRGKSIETGKWCYGSLLTENTTWAYITNSLPNNEVDPETVGQFTGLLDIEGKEIYEGDILQDEQYSELTGVVEWFNGRYVVTYSDDDDDFDTLGFILDNYLQVIGNIYDNPELLEVGK